MSKAKHYLETATNIAVIIAALVVSGVFILNYLRPNDRRTRRLQAGFEKGQQLAQIPGIAYGEAPKTLLIALNTNCGFCTESIHFYNRLAEIQRASNSKTRIITIFPSTAKEIQQYAEQHRLGLNTMAAVDFRALNVAGTPTMILVDTNGRVIDFWIGKPSESTERQIIKQVT